MLANLRKLACSRLHLLPEHGPSRVQALLSDALYTCFPSAGLALQPIMPSQCKSMASRADLPADEETELTLPDDLSVIARLNPQLRDVMLAHQEHARASAKGALRQRLQDLIAQHDAPGGGTGRPGRPNITKTSLSKLRLDELRAALEEENADARGNKDVLVQRLLALVQEREQHEGEVLPALSDLKEGVVTRRQISQQEKRQRRQQQHHSTYGITEQALYDAQAAAVVGKAQYASIFKPEEVADMLLEARAGDVCIIDVRRRAPFTDYFVLGTARSQRMVHVLASGVLHQLKSRSREVAPGVRPSIEGGKDDSEWKVVDAGSVVVHIFLEGYREEYDLEGLWGAPDGSNVRWLEPRQTLHTLSTLRV